MTLLAIALPLARRSAVRIPRRDLEVGAGDDFTLRVSLVEADRPDAAAVNLAARKVRLVMHAWRFVHGALAGTDYGRSVTGPLVMTAAAMARPDDPMVADLTIAAGGADWCLPSAAFRWALQAEIAGAGTALCWGAVRVGPDFGVPPLPVLTDDYRPALTDAGERWLF